MKCDLVVNVESFDDDAHPSCNNHRQTSIHWLAFLESKRIPMPNRCEWATTQGMIAYHDEEWGVPVHDDRLLFEFLILEGAQAGLSWETILKKRENYRKLFDDFDAVKISRYTKRKIDKLLTNAGIVRNRLKVESTVSNAKAFLKLQNELGSFDAYLWDFVDGRPLQGARKSMSDIPASTPESEALSKDLKRRSFRFVGPTICYAFMQAVGMVNDHTVDCFRHQQVQSL